MATEREFIEYVADQAASAGSMSFRRMFGEYALYIDDKVVAFACDNSLFIKPSAAAVELAPLLPQRPPYPGAKDYPVADELLDDSDALRELVLRTAELMPPPKPANPSRKRRKNTAP